MESSLNDYLQSGLKSTPLQEVLNSEGADSRLEYATGLIQAGMFLGGIEGGVEGLIEIIPSLLHSASGLANGLYALALNPMQVSVEFISSCKECVNCLRENPELLKECIPEVKELVDNFDKTSEFQKGELMGKIIGKYGVNAFAAAKIAKAGKAYLDLKRANTLLTFEAFNKAPPEKATALAQASQKWRNQHLKTIEEFKAGKEMIKPFQGKYLDETAARKVLHQAGFKTFPRFKGLPENYRVKLSGKGGGMKYVHPNDEGTYIRVMPGTSHSPHPCQQKPYVNRRINGQSIDKFGKVVAQDSPEAHIPLEEFTFITEP